MAGLLFDGIPSTENDSSTFSGTNFLVGGSLVANRINDSNGALFSASVGSTAVYGAKVQAGTAGPLLAATGSIVFGTLFSNSNFVTVITPQVSGTLYPFIVSGTTTYSTSGITYGGQSGLSYNWIAVGV